MRTLKESILSDIESNLSLGDDEVAKMHILEELHNSHRYYYDKNRGDDKYFNIYKNRNKWLVDVNGFITCYCPDGYVTDGSFEFGAIQKDFMICAEDDGDPCNCKSLQYGPKIVYGEYTIDACNDLKDLKHCPIHVYGEILVRDTGITTLKYFPKNCYAAKIINNKYLKSLKGTKPCSVKRQIFIVGNGIDTTMDMLTSMGWRITDALGASASSVFISDDSDLGKIFNGRYQNMKTLYESLLSDIDTNLKQGNSDVEKVITFGKRFIFDRAIVGSASGDILNAISLKKLTNGMDYMSDKIDRGQFDKRGKVKMFANLIDHLSLADLEVNIMGNTGEDFRKDLTVKLNKYCKDNNVFINDDKVHMWVVSERATGKDELHIIVARTDKYSNSYMFKLAYKIE